jgi:RHS repeat-associated protein
VRGLAFDKTRRRLWVATASSLQAYDDGTKASLQAALPADAALVGLGVAEESGAVWAVGGGHLWKLGPDGRLLASQEIPGLLTVTGDAHGGAWAATARDLYHVGPGGRVLARLQPFAGAGTIGALAVQPRDGAVWAANEVDLAKVSGAGKVVRRVSFEPPVRLRALALAAAAEENPKARPRTVRVPSKSLSPTQATVTGFVRLPNGQPAVGATVNLLGQSGLSATTDASGRFTITPVAASPSGTSLGLAASLSTSSGALYGTLSLTALGGMEIDIGWIDLLPVCDAAFKALPTPAPNGTVKALTVYDDGSGPALYVGGAFTTVGGLTVNGIAKWNGTTWSALGSGLSGTSPEVDALAVYNDGAGAKLYAAGKFTKSGTTTINYVAKWSGTSWSQVGSGLASQVFALTVWNGSLYAGGSFTTVGSTNFNHLARWNGTAWSTVGGGVAGNVLALAAYDDGGGAALYVGGAFATAGTGSLTVNRIAKWNGTAWSALGTSGGGVAGGTPEVDALAVWNDGGGSALFVGGKFSTVNNTAISAKYVARWRSGAWSAVGSGLATQVLALAPFDDGTGPALYAGGAFTTISGVPYNRLARWNGASWDPVIDGVDNTVSALAVVPSGSGAGLYLGGAFGTASGVTASRIVRWWRPATCADTTGPWLFFSQPDWDATVGSSTPAIGLGFTDAGSGVNTSTLAIQANGSPLAVHCTFGSVWGLCTPDAPLPSGLVELTATIKDGAGNLSDPGAYTRFTIQDIAAPDLTIASPAAGATVTSVYPVFQLHADDHGGSGVDPTSVAAELNGSPVGVDCRFTGADGQCVLVPPLDPGPAQVSFTARDLAGNLSSPATVAFTAAPVPPPTTTLHGTVRLAGGSPAEGATVKVNEEPLLYATTAADGSFSIAGAGAAPGVRLSLTASLDTLVGFASHVAPVAAGVTEVGTITLQGSCDLRFKTVPFASTDGGLENRQSSGPYPLTGTSAVYDDGTGPALYLGGAFTHAGGHEVNGVAKWTGSAWKAAGGGVLGGLTTAVNALAVFDDGTGSALYAGGEFTSAGGALAANLARWDGHAWSEVGRGVSAAVTGMAVYNDGSGAALYLMGKFTSVESATTWDGRSLAIPSSGFAKWDGHAWTVLPKPSADPNARLKVLPNGAGTALYAFGLDGLFQWNPAGGSWTQLLGDADLQAYPSKTLEDFTVSNGTLYVAGLSMGVLKRNGSSWQQILSAGASIVSLAAVTEGGQPVLYAAGAFTANGPVKLGRFNGTAWTQPLAEGKVLFAASGVGTGTVLYGGETANGYTNREAVPALWTGNAWTPLTAAGDTTGDVTSAAAFDDGSSGSGETLFFAGPTTAGGVALNGGIGRWDGTHVTAAGIGLEGGGSAVFVLDDGTGPALYAVAAAAGRIAKWNGTGWTTLGSPLGVEIDTLAVADLGTGPRLYAGGHGVFRWNGAFWASLGGPTSVRALAGYNGTLYAGGGSSELRDEVLQRYDGSAWSAVAGAPNDTVEALEVWNGSLYLGGSFVQAGGEPHFGLAAYTGSAWVNTGCGYLGNRDFTVARSPLFGAVHALKALSAGGASQLVIGGDYLSACDSDSGSTISAYRLPYSYVNLGTGVDGPVYALSIASQGNGPEVVVGGSFVSAGGQPSAKLAVWTTLPSFGQCSPAGQPPAITLTSPTDGTVTSAAQQVFTGFLDEPATLTVDGQGVGVAADLTFSSPPVPLALGANVVTLAATDPEGLSRQVQVTVVRDPAPPTIAFTSPASGATVLTARPTLAVSYDDPGSGVVPGTLAFRVNGTALAVSCVADTAGARCTPAVDLSTGAVTVTATVADRAGNSATASAAFTVAPAASSTTTVTGLVARADGSPVAGARVTVLGKSGATGITGADGRFTISGVDVSDGAALSLIAQATAAGSALVGTAAVAPVPGGTADAGTITLRTSCAPGFTSGLFAGVGVTGGSPSRVSALAVYDDGHGPALYAGGAFTAAGGTSASNLAKWDGHAWAPVGGGLNGPVQALAVFDDGSGSGPALYAAGDFSGATAFPGSLYQPANRVARWNGTSWSPLGAGLGGKVYALAVWNGALYAAGGLNVPYVSRWNPAFGTWSAAGSGAPDGTVYALGVFNGALYAGGLFTTIGGVPAQHIARWDGSSWSPLGAGTSGGVYSLAVFDDGHGPALYAGGTFENAGDLSLAVGGIARWTGSAWDYAGNPAAPAFSAGGVLAEGPQGVEALAVYDDGSGSALYALGMIHETGLAGIARFRSGSWSALGAGVELVSYGGAALAVFDDHIGGTGAALFAGGDFASAGQLGVNGIGRWQGGAWSGLGTGLNGSISALAVYDDGTGPALVAGGAFTAASGRTVSHMGRWSGSGWSPLGNGTDGTVSALAVSGSGSGALLYAAGDFTLAGASTASRAASWNGQSWASLGGGFDNRVRSLARWGSTLYAGGDFTTAAGSPAGHVAGWNGTSWSPLGAGTDGSVRVLVAGAVGGGATKLYVGGTFSHAGGGTAANISAWDGASWAPLGSGLNGEVDSLAIWDDGLGPALYAGGAFTASGSTGVAHLARWNGTAWTTVGGGTSGTVSALAVFDDGSGPALYAGGSFTTAGGVTVNGFARFNGTAWTALGDGTTAGSGVGNGAVLALQPLSEPSGPALYLGGSFGLAGGQTAVSLARWSRSFSCFAADSTPPALQFTAPAAGSFTTATPQLSVSWSDDESGVDPASLLVQANGSALAVTCTSTATSAQCTPQAPLSEGAVSFSATVADHAGNPSAPATLSLIVDTQAPALAFSQPAAGAVSATATPQLAFTWSDGGSGVDSASLAVQANGATLPVSCTANGSSAQCTPQAPLPEGAVSLSATVADHAGNRSTPATRSITIDTQAPGLAFTQPASGAFVGTANPQVVVTWSDAASGIDATSFQISGPGTFTCTTSASGATCQPVSAFAEGAVSLMATVSDHAGNSANASLSFTVDTAAPTLSITAPAEGATVPATGLQIQLTWSDAGSGINASSLALTDDGATLSASCTTSAAGAVCTQGSPLASGAHTVAATVADRSGKSSTATIHFTVVSTTPPMITVTAPADGTITSAATITLSGSVSRPATLTVNGTAVPLDGANAFTYEAPLAEASNRFELLATAAGGLTATAAVTVVRDSTPPVISILEPKPSSYHDPATPLQLLVGDSGAGIDPATLSLTLNGSPLVADCTVCAPLVTCTPRSALPDGALSLAASAHDRAGSAAAADPIRFTAQAGYDITPPVITLTSPAAGAVTSSTPVHLVGRLSEAATLTVNGSPATLDGSLGFDAPVALTEGVNTFTLTATDANGNSSTLTVTVTLDSGAPGPIDPTRVTVGTPSGGSSTVTGAAGCVAPVRSGWTVVVTDLLTGATTAVPAAADGSFAASLPARGGDALSIAVRSTANVFGPARTVTIPGVPQLPPDPASVAPALDLTVATDLCAATAFLYTGSDPVQAGVSAGAVDCRRVAVLRGKVLDRAGAPLSAVRVSVLHHPELGSTLTRADGAWDLAVNGGGDVLVELAKPGYLPAQRKVSAGWRAWATAPDVVLVPLDSQATAIDLTASAPVQVARGSVVTDGDGTRRATVLFVQGTQASLVYPGGAAEPLPSLTVRATEYTVGANGPQAMPGELPPTSAYTYAVELSADEAASAGANEIRFDRPVPVYLENFLAFPTGTVVPAGYYDRTMGRWVPAPNGKVIAVLSATSGLADLDVDGSGQVASASALAALGISDAEREQLASLYTPGQSLWRVPVSHFTPWDFNYFASLPPAARPPKLTHPKGGDGDKKDKACLCSGSVIEAENQILGEVVGVNGTPLTLNYRSDRVPGRKIADTLDVPVSEPSLPANTKRVEMEVQVAGQTISQTFAAGPDQHASLTWDGKDAYGRPVQGRQPYTARVGYVFDGHYQAPPSGCNTCFGLPGNGSVTTNPARQEVTLWQSFDGKLGTWDARKAFGLGGWSLSAHHSYDPNEHILYYGDGSRRSAQGKVITRTLAGQVDDPTPSGDGGPADEAGIGAPVDVMVEPDGSLHILTSEGGVRLVLTNGVISTEHPDHNPPSGIPPSLTQLAGERGPDGLIYLAADNAIWRIEADGTLTNVVSDPDVVFYPSIGIHGFRTPLDIAFGPDGMLYVFNGTNPVFPDGFPRSIVIDRIDVATFNWDHYKAGDLVLEEDLRFEEHRQTAGILLGLPVLGGGLTFGPDGSLYFSVARQCDSVWRLSPSGLVTKVAGSFKYGQTDGVQDLYLNGVVIDCTRGAGDGGPAQDAFLFGPKGMAVAHDGTLYIADAGNHTVRAVAPDGTIGRFAGTGTAGAGASGEAASRTALSAPLDVKVLPDDRVVIADTGNDEVRTTDGALTGSSTSVGQIRVPEEDGSAVYVFDATGRHLWTEDARTGSKLVTFGYDDHGRLVSVTDAFTNVTTIERDAAGQPTAIVAPFGQRTTLALDANGYLSTVTNPAAEEVDFTYSADGLLQSMTDPKRRTYQYTFDGLGRLQKDEDPLHGFTALARTEDTSSFTVARSSAMGRTTTYKTEQLPGGDERDMTTYPDGTALVVLKKSDGSTVTTRADGTVLTVASKSDPRFGLQTPLVETSTFTTPGGLTSTTASSRTITSVDPDNPKLDLSDPKNIALATDMVTVDGRTTTSTTDFVTRTMTVTTPMGRQSSATSDAFGRLVESRLPGILPSVSSYDAKGRLQTVTQGTRTVTYTYNPQGRLATVTDPLSRTVSYGYDAAGRVTSTTLPDSRQVSFTYDANGNLTTLTPPTRPQHGFDYDETDRPKDYTPPSVGAGTNDTVYSYNLDHQLTGVSRPDGQSVIYSYDATSGRLDHVTTPLGDYSYQYDPTSGSLTSAHDPTGGSLTFTYDGSLPKSVTWAGAVAGSIGWSYDNHFQLVSQTVNGGNTVTFGFDQDGLLTQAGSLVLAHDPLSGALTGTTLGGVSDTYGYSSYGELASYGASYQGSPLYSTTYTRDAGGRIHQKVEALGGATSTYTYAYDPAGRLTDVQKDGIAFEHYEYDGNGNRTAWTDPVGSGTATYDDQDRLLAYGPNTYTYTANGELATKSANGVTVQYSYDVFGNLRAVQLPTGIQVEYLIDANNRRIGKRVNGTLVTGYLYQNRTSPLAELDGTGNVVTRFVYGISATVPEYMVRAGVTYRYITDAVGSVRLVVNTSDGSVAQRLDYDAFGRLLFDSNPGFQPFGFAGGLYDPQTGLIRFGARDYDPETGRWTTKDPAGFGGGDTNLYGYVVNDPVNLNDPSGLSWASGARGFVKGLLVGAVVGFTAAVVVAVAPVAAPFLLAAGVIGLATTAIEGYTLFTDPCASSDEKHEFIGNVLGGVVGGAAGAWGGSTFAKGLPSGLGDLTLGEVKQIQSVVDDAGRPLEVVGSAAKGDRRGVGTDLPIGKGPGTRSDIDYTTAGANYDYFRGLERSLPSANPETPILMGGADPYQGPAIRFEPETKPTIIPQRR